VVAQDSEVSPKTKPRVFEFFLGGGLVRLGFGADWDCVGAIDNDAKKVAAYNENFGISGLIHDDSVA
jgi:site-specific DNA-cytosine methylase